MSHTVIKCLQKISEVNKTPNTLCQLQEQHHLNVQVHNTKSRDLLKEKLCFLFLMTLIVNEFIKIKKQLTGLKCSLSTDKRFI